MIERAFVGYAIGSRGLFIRCCSYCPDKAALEEWAEKKKTPITHTICPECAQQLMATVTGEQT